MRVVYTDCCLTDVAVDSECERETFPITMYGTFATGGSGTWDDTLGGTTQEFVYDADIGYWVYVALASVTGCACDTTFKFNMVEVVPGFLSIVISCTGVDEESLSGFYTCDPFTAAFGWDLSFSTAICGNQFGGVFITEDYP